MLSPASLERSAVDDARPASTAAKEKSLLDYAIDGFLVLWLLLLSNAVIPLLMLGNAEAMSADDLALLRLLIVPFIIVTPLLLVANYQAVSALLLRNAPLVVLLVWIWCSVTWSIEPGVSARRALSLTMFTLLASYVVIRHDVDWLLRVLSWLILVILLLSVVFIVAMPALGTMPDGRGLRGVYTHKNGMGELLVLAAIVLPPAIKHRLVRPSLGWAGLVLAAALVLPVNSATATIVILMIMSVHLALAIWRQPFAIAVATTALGIGIASFGMIVLAANVDGVFALLGRDATFTGRVDIWRYTMAMIEQRPFLGYGFNAFWDAPVFAQYALDSYGWIVPNAHNGYLDITLGIGIVGLMLTVVFLGSSALRSFRHIKGHSGLAGGIVLTITLSYLSRALLETNLLGQNSIMWVLIVIFTLALTPGIGSLRKHA